MKSSFLDMELARGNAPTSLLRRSHRLPVTLAGAIGIFTLAHFTAQMLVGIFCMVHWLMRCCLDIGFLFMLPFDFRFSEMPGGQALLVLLQPIRSCPLPDWLWQTPLTAFLLAALNSFLWGAGLGTLVCAIWGFLRRFSHPAHYGEGIAPLVEPNALPGANPAVGSTILDRS